MVRIWTVKDFRFSREVTSQWDGGSSRAPPQRRPGPVGALCRCSPRDAVAPSGGAPLGAWFLPWLLMTRAPRPLAPDAFHAVAEGLGAEAAPPSASSRAAEETPGVHGGGLDAGIPSPHGRSGWTAPRACSSSFTCTASPSCPSELSIRPETTHARCRSGRGSSRAGSICSSVPSSQPGTRTRRPCVRSRGAPL